MPVVDLHNRDWGLETSCFVCEPRNDGGLRVPFSHDTDAGFVFADFRLGAAFSGAPTYIHGGIVLSLLDEACAWATIAVERTFAVTETMSSSFHRPVRVDREYRVVGRVTSVAAEGCDTAAEITDDAGDVCAEATARMAVLSPAQMVDAAGPGYDEETFRRYMSDGSEQETS